MANKAFAKQLEASETSYWPEIVDEMDWKNTNIILQEPNGLLAISTAVAAKLKL